MSTTEAVKMSDIEHAYWHLNSAESNLTFGIFHKVVDELRTAKRILENTEEEITEYRGMDLEDRFDCILSRLRYVIARDESDWWCIHHYSFTDCSVPDSD